MWVRRGTIVPIILSERKIVWSENDTTEEKCLPFVGLGKRSILSCSPSSYSSRSSATWDLMGQGVHCDCVFTIVSCQGKVPFLLPKYMGVMSISKLHPTGSSIPCLRVHKDPLHRGSPVFVKRLFPPSHSVIDGSKCRRVSVHETWSYPLDPPRKGIKRHETLLNLYQSY